METYFFQALQIVALAEEVELDDVIIELPALVFDVLLALPRSVKIIKFSNYSIQDLIE